MDGQPPPGLLLAEGDQAMRAALVRAFELEGYRVTAVADGARALDAAGATEHDIIVLDRRMPHVDGLTACRRLRARGVATPILMLTGQSGTADRVAGLDAGADDYVSKPFALDELMARLRALLRRSRPPDGDDLLRVADFALDPAGRQAWRGERQLELTRTEFELLELLARNVGVVLGHSTIYDRVWGHDFGTDSKNLTVYVRYLRKKTEAAGEARLIHTVRGVGYVMRAS
jgi:two-component system response regulator MprA